MEYQAFIKSSSANLFQLSSQYTSKVCCLVSHRILINQGKLMKRLKSNTLWQVFDHPQYTFVKVPINFPRCLKVLKKFKIKGLDKIVSQKQKVMMATYQKRTWIAYWMVTGNSFIFAVVRRRVQWGPAFCPCAVF